LLSVEKFHGWAEVIAFHTQAPKGIRAECGRNDEIRFARHVPIGARSYRP